MLALKMQLWGAVVMLLSVFVAGRSDAAANRTASAGRDGKVHKIILIAGTMTGHDKYTHEYERSVILLKYLLDTAVNVKNVRTEAYFHGWPADEHVLDAADTIVLVTDGSDRNETDHPLYVGDHLQTLARQMRRGCGFVQFHWSTFAPSRFHDQITDWIGGYFDYETGSAANHWYSAIQTYTAPTAFGTPDHPICRGVKPFTVQEEFYYRIRFRPDDPRIKPILLTRPPNETQDFPVGWAVQRQDGGRGFGFTGGHFYKNWWLPDYRKLILNAIVWTAGIDVPPGGVETRLDPPIKALILTGHHHPGHDWRHLTAALIQTLEQDPRIDVDVTEHIEDLAASHINDYRLLVMNYNNWEFPGLSEAAKAHFVQYLKNGGGLELIHFANGAFNYTLPNKESDWQEEPLAWAYRYGKGRIFQTLLGHDERAVRLAGALIRRGATWAAECAPLTFDPPVALLENAPFRNGSPWTVEKSLQLAAIGGNVGGRSAESPLADGHFGKALNARAGGAFAPTRADYRNPPLTVECWAKLHSKGNYNILIANENKSSATHWEMFTFAGSGRYAVYMPGMTPDHARTDIDICDDKWHYLAMVYTAGRIRLYVDGKQAVDQAITFNNGPTQPGDLAFGSLVSRELGCDGLIDDVRLSQSALDIRACLTNTERFAYLLLGGKYACFAVI
jgi:type 1 glutamine amidotransferase